MRQTNIKIEIRGGFVKIWCLRCGKKITEIHNGEHIGVECPVCGLEMNCSVENEIGHVSVAVKDVQLRTNNEIYIYNLCS